MARIICQVLHRPDRITFIWSQDKAFFEPYHLAGPAFEEFRDLVRQAREGLGATDAKGLAAVGHRLYKAIFPEAARAVRDWLEGMNAVESLEIVSDAAGLVPWNVVLPDEKNLDSFWGLRYSITAGRRVNPLREFPDLEKPDIVLAVDPGFRQSLSDKERNLLTDFAKEKALLVVESREQLSTAFKSQPPEFVAFFCRADGQSLFLGDDRLSPADVETMIEEGGGNPDPVICFNLSSAGQGGATPTRAFLNAGFHGLIGCEAALTPSQANAFGVAFLQKFLYGGETVGQALQKARSQAGPAGLAYTAFCPVNLRTVWEEGAGEHAGPEPEALPDSPYRPLMPYDREDRALFAGRADDVDAFATQFDAADNRLLVLHGASGVGKSSFLRAGVVPYLEDFSIGYRALRDRRPDETPAAEEDHVVLSIRASQDLLGQLAEGLCAFCAQPYVYTTPAGQTVSVDLPEILRGEMTRQSSSTGIQAGVTGIKSEPDPLASIKPAEITAPALWEKMHEDPAFLARLMTRITERLPFETVILIEQGEEFFTRLTSSQERRRRQAMTILADAISTYSGKWIFSLRTDFFGRLVHFFPRQGKLVDFLLTPLTQEELVEAILLPTSTEPILYSAEIPFNRYGFAFEDGLAVKLADEVLKAAAAQQVSPLALLQTLCAGLVEQTKSRPDRVIHASDVTRLGGVEVALSKYVEGKIKSLPVPGLEQKALRALMDDLYVREPDGTVTRRVLPAGDVAQMWKGTAVGATVEQACADECRLLEVNHLLIGGKENDYVSLSQDSLAQLGVQWTEEKKYRKGFVLFSDMLWIVVPLMVLVAAVTLWWVRRGTATAGDDMVPRKLVETELKKLQLEFNEKQKEISNLKVALRVEEAGKALQIGNGGKASLLLENGFQNLGLLKKEPSFEWKYLWSLTQGKRAPLLARSFLTAAVLASNDGKTLAGAGMDGDITLWNVADGKVLAIFRGHKDAILGLAFSPDGKTLASAGEDQTVRIWDGTGAKTLELHVIKEPAKGAVRAVAFSTDGAKLAFAGDDKKVFIWSVKEQKVIQELEGKSGAVHALLFGPKDAFLASAGADGVIRLWDPAGNVQKELKGNNGPIHTLALHPDGKTLASGGAEIQGGFPLGVIRQWDLAQGTEKGPSMRHSVGVFAVTYAGDGKFLLSGGKDSLLRLWDAATAKEKAAKVGHLLGIVGLALSPDGKTLYSAGQDGKIRFWEVENLPASDELPQGDWATAVVFSKNNKVLVSGGRDGSVKFWDVASARPLEDLPKLPKLMPAITSLALHSEGKIWKLAVGVATDKDKGQIHLWEIDTEKKMALTELPTLPGAGHEAGVTAVAFSPNGKILASGSRDATAILWDLEAKKNLRTLTGHKGPVLCLAWDQGGKLLATGGQDRTIRKWNTEKDEKPVIYAGPGGHLGPVTSLSFALNVLPQEGGEYQYISTLLSGSQDLTLKYWNFGLSQDENYFGHAGPLLGIAWNQTKKFFVTASWDTSLKIWSPESGTERYTLTGHTGPVRAVAISFDGITIASASQDGTVRLWRGPEPQNITLRKVAPLPDGH